MKILQMINKKTKIIYTINFNNNRIINNINKIIISYKIINYKIINYKIISYKIINYRIMIF